MKQWIDQWSNASRKDNMEHIGDNENELSRYDVPHKCNVLFCNL